MLKGWKGGAGLIRNRGSFACQTRCKTMSEGLASIGSGFCFRRSCPDCSEACNHQPPATRLDDPVLRSCATLSVIVETLFKIHL